MTTGQAKKFSIKTFAMIKSTPISNKMKIWKNLMQESEGMFRMKIARKTTKNISLKSLKVIRDKVTSANIVAVKLILKLGKKEIRKTTKISIHKSSLYAMKNKREALIPNQRKLIKMISRIKKDPTLEVKTRVKEASINVKVNVKKATDSKMLGAHLATIKMKLILKTSKSKHLLFRVPKNMQFTKKSSP